MQPTEPLPHPLRIAVLIPCYNEAPSIAGVVQDFKRVLPEATIYVYDNQSTDGTAQIASKAGAVVRSVTRRGKGYVMRQMFYDIKAELFIMVDGDGTYAAQDARTLLDPILRGEADMVIGSRLLGDTRAFKRANLLANRVFRGLLNTLFHVRITDLLSGYRALNQRVTKTVPFMSRGFEIETELTIKCLERDLRVVEVPTQLAERMEGTHSKIHVWRDTWLILQTLVALARDYKPLTTFGALGLICIGLGLMPGLIVIREYSQMGVVVHIPSAVLAVGLVLTGLLIGLAGIVLHTIARRFQELDQQLQKLIDSPQ
jgi:glycosyltransferase involved in cell wall biosynthesis